MAVNGLGNYNYRWNNNYSKANGRAENDDGRKSGQTKSAESKAHKTDSYKPTYDYSDEVKKDMAFAKTNGLDYELIKKGQLYEGQEKLAEREQYSFLDPKKNEDYDKAMAEWNKFKELKAAAEAKNPAEAATAPDKEGTEQANTATDPKTGIYKPDMDKVREMKANLKGNVSAFKQMVASLFKGQSGFASDAMKAVLNIDEDTRAKAEAAISEDGEWGVNATASRILDFAKALSGGDPAKIEELKEAVMKGFKAAEKLWGGKLPEISYQTLQKVMDGFDEWAKGGTEAEEAAATVEA